MCCRDALHRWSYVLRKDIIVTQRCQCFILDVPELLATSSDTLNITDSDGDYSLSCTFRGAPQPEVMWYFSNKAITSGALYTVQDTVTVDGFFTKVSSQLKFAGMIIE